MVHLKARFKVMACVLMRIRVRLSSMPQRGCSTVAVSGEGRRAYWTKRALERAGFQVGDTGAEWCVDIREGMPGVLSTAAWFENTILFAI